MGKSELRELENRLALLFTHLLKWRYQPTLRCRSWELEIREQRRRLRRHFAQNSSYAISSTAGMKSTLATCSKPLRPSAAERTPPRQLPANRSRVFRIQEPSAKLDEAQE